MMRALVKPTLIAAPIRHGVAARTGHARRMRITPARGTAAIAGSPHRCAADDRNRRGIWEQALAPLAHNPPCPSRFGR